MLEASFVDETKYLSISPLYSLVADLLLFLYKLESETIKESSGVFWKTMSRSVETHIKQAQQDNNYTLVRYVDYFNSFVKKKMFLAQLTADNVERSCHNHLILQCKKKKKKKKKKIRRKYCDGEADISKELKLTVCTVGDLIK